jgi:hypothetical protein
MWKLFGLLLLPAALLILPVSHACAQVAIIDNLSNPDEGNLSVASIVHWANGFTTDGEDHFLENVQISLDLPGNTATDLKLELWSGDTNLPDTMLNSLNTTVNPASSGVFTYTPDTLTLLASNTTYWVVLSVESGDGQYEWNVTRSPAQSGVGAIGGLATFFGGSWSASPASDRGILAVNAMPIPEPASIQLVGLAALAFILFLKMKAVPGARQPFISRKG